MKSYELIAGLVFIFFKYNYYNTKADKFPNNNLRIFRKDKFDTMTNYFIK